MAGLTPMMAQYKEIKNAHPDCLLFFRLGDFYELFFEDALIASQTLDLTLTGRDCGLAERAPMCGVPYHAAKGYVAKLVAQGYKVAICDQMEEAGKGKPLVRRAVTRVVTAGTVTDDQMLDSAANNYVACVYDAGRQIGFAFADVTTGAFYCAQMPKPPAGAEAAVTDELARIGCAELIVNDKFSADVFPATGVKPQVFDKRAFEPETARRRLLGHFRVEHLSAFGVDDTQKAQIGAAGALLTYLYETQKTALSHFVKLTPYRRERHLALDAGSRRHLELTKTVSGQRRGSLLWALDETKTPPGARLLRRWIEQPLVDIDEIHARLNAVGEWDANARDEIRAILGGVRDMERLVSKVVYGGADGRVFRALAESLSAVPAVKAALAKFTGSLHRYFRAELDDCADIRNLIDRAIMDDPPAGVKEGGFVRDGYSAELDACRSAKRDGASWLMALEAEERDAGNIKNMKIKYNRVFGYYFEITNANLGSLPPHFIRRQTLANCERFTTPRLKEIEDAILGADERAAELEYAVYTAIRAYITKEAARILSAANMLATIDALQSLAEAAAKHGYVKPALNTDGRIEIKDGRHPVIERLVAERFITNDTRLDMDAERMMILTGPNMAGKSTYMRQVALITLMAQMGSFVPAKKADISVCDQIFTRVGASDDLATGQSTFMVEMNEVANILNNATKNSLIILDEIGRGTSTFDGLAIAWAVLEHIADAKRLGAKTLFATHYHELTELEGRIPGVVNYHATVKEAAGGIVFLRKIKPGGAGHSYGIQVARLAGLPERVLGRASEILSLLDSADVAKLEADMGGEPVRYGQYQKPDSFGDRLIFKEILAIDPDAPPLVVIDKLRQMQARLGKL